MVALASSPAPGVAGVVVTGVVVGVAVGVGPGSIGGGGFVRFAMAMAPIRSSTMMQTSPAVLVLCRRRARCSTSSTLGCRIAGRAESRRSRSAARR